MEVAGLNFEKVWYKVLGQVIYNLESKTMVYKTLHWNDINDYNYMNKLNFYLQYYKYLKVSLFQCQGVVTILQVGIAKTG